MGKYTYSRSNVALSTTNDTMTFIAAASRRARIIEIGIGGQGTASAANTVGVYRSTGGTTGGGALTGTKANSDLPTAAGTVNTTWAAQPTTSGDPLIQIPVNANGGVYRWLARADQTCEFRNSEQISIRSLVGTSNISIMVVVEEDY